MDQYVEKKGARESQFLSPRATPFSRVVRPSVWLLRMRIRTCDESVGGARRKAGAGPRNKEGIKFVSAFGSTHTFAAELIELVHTPVQMAILKLTLAEKNGESDPHPSPPLGAERRMNG